MEIAAGATLLLGFISAGKQKDAYNEAARQSRDIAKRNATRIEAESQERVRQQRAEQERTVNTARAVAGASGALVSSESHREYGAGLWDAAQKEIDWTLRSGQSQSDIALAEGDWSARTSQAQGDAAWWSTMAGSVSNAAGFLG